MFNLHNHAERLFRVFPAIRILGFDIMEMQRKLGDNFGGIFMDKEEILRKAQKEDSDEMKVQIRDKSMKWTYISMVIAAGVFSLYQRYAGVSNNGFNSYSMHFSSCRKFLQICERKGKTNVKSLRLTKSLKIYFTLTKRKSAGNPLL